MASFKQLAQVLSPRPESFEQISQLGAHLSVQYMVQRKISASGEFPPALVAASAFDDRFKHLFYANFPPI
jgi:hypothetical protein